MSRRLVAALACRANGSRLYGKPLQNLDIEKGYTILDHIIEGAKAINVIDEVVLGISEGVENLIFIDVAKRHNISYILGSQKDVLMRLIQCGRAGAATDVFRVTTECPFIAWEMLRDAWDHHISGEYDISVTDYLGEGLNFEIYTLNALERCHTKGNNSERSEFCSAYARRNPHEFKIKLIVAPEEWQRMNYRLTVDYPEDLIVCRTIYEALKDKGPHIPVPDIIKFIDRNPEVHKILEPYVDETPIWASVLEKR